MKHNEEEVEIKVNEKISLAGSLVLPESAPPQPRMVLFLHGSGPVDRNENVGRMQELNIFNTLADRLADVGVPSFRYDKRGTGKSGGDLNSSSLNDLVEDAIAVMDHLVSSTFENGKYSQHKFICVGHSEGTLLGAILSQKRPHLVDSLVLVCPFCTQMEELLKHQAAAMEKTLDEEKGCTGALTRSVVNSLGLQPTKVQAKLIARIKESTQPTFRFLLVQTIPALWFREHFAMDYEAVYREVAVPTAVVVASYDVQCDPKDGERIASLIPSGGAELIVVDKLTHFLRKEETNTGFAGYAKQLKEPLDEELINVVSKWCSGRLEH